jgi:hypothetical protein
MAPCVVLLNRSQLTPLLRDRLEQAPDVVLIEVADILPAPEPLASHTPALLLLGNTVSWSPAGWQFVERFRALSPETDLRVLPDNEIAMAKLFNGPAEAPAAPNLMSASFPLTRVPARRIRRRAMPSGTTALVNGRPAFLIDVSPLGAQVLTRVVLKPSQLVSFNMSSRPQSRVRGHVAWSLYELTGPGGAPHYRAGIGFEGTYAGETEGEQALTSDL